MDKYKISIGKPLDKNIIEEIRSLNFNGNDVRAAWVGPGVPNYTNNMLGLWAHHHLSMYLGFIYEFLIDVLDYKINILDVGCGSGHATVTIAEIFPNAKIVAIDNNLACINFANKYNKTDNIDYRCVDATVGLPNKESFDLVFCLEIFEHINPKSHDVFMDNCFASLSQDGFMFFTTPNNSANEPDSHKGHIGMLNVGRAKLFFTKFKDNIIDESFYSNTSLHSLDIEDFIERLPKEEHDKLAKDFSHFRFVMKK